MSAPSTEKKAVLKIFLDDNMFLRQVGLNNTFKTLSISESTTTGDIHALMVSLMQKAMPQNIRDIIEEQCKNYRIFLHVNSSERLLTSSDRPWTLAILAEPRPKLFFRPVEPSAAAASGPSSSSSSSSPSTAEGEASDEGGIKVFLGDNPVLRYLGLHNTQKTISISSKDTTPDVERKIVSALIRGLTREQIDLIREQTLFYRLFAQSEGKSPKLLAAAEKPWNTQRKRPGKPAPKLLFQLCSVADDDPFKKAPALIKREIQLQRAKLAADSQALKPLEAIFERAADPLHNFQAALTVSLSSSSKAPDCRAIISALLPLADTCGHQDSGIALAAPVLESFSALSARWFDLLTSSSLLPTIASLLHKAQNPQLKDLREQVSAAAAQYTDALDAADKNAAKASKSHPILSSSSLNYQGLHRQYASALQDVVSGLAQVEELLIGFLHTLQASCDALLRSLQQGLKLTSAAALPRIAMERKSFIDRKRKQSAHEVYEGYLLSCRAGDHSWVLRWFNLGPQGLSSQSDWLDTGSQELVSLHPENGAARLDVLASDSEAAGKQPFCFQVTSPSNSITCRAMDQYAFDGWVAALREAIGSTSSAAVGRSPAKETELDEIRDLMEQCQALRETLRSNCNRIDEQTKRI
ncbi:MAG: hypothetical protein Q8P67_11370 [archaeon]|nr:hypothetical protein [archaeon]